MIYIAKDTNPQGYRESYSRRICIVAVRILKIPKREHPPTSEKPLEDLRLDSRRWNRISAPSLHACAGSNGCCFCLKMFPDHHLDLGRHPDKVMAPQPCGPVTGSSEEGAKQTCGNKAVLPEQQVQQRHDQQFLKVLKNTIVDFFFRMAMLSFWWILAWEKCGEDRGAR